MTQPKNEQDKKNEDQFKNTRTPFNPEFQAASGKPTPEVSKPKEPEKKPAELEAQVQQTRGALSGDVKALNDKLSPDRLKDEAKGMVVEAKNAAVETAVEVKDKVVDTLVEAKDATVQKVVETTDVVAEKLHDYKEVATQVASDAGDQAMRAGRATWSFARQNALPLAVIGIGASWLFASSRSSARSSQRPRVRREIDYRNAPGYDDGEDLADRFVDSRAATPLVTSSQYGQRPAARVTRTNGGNKPSSALSHAADRAGHEAKEVGEQVKDLAVRTGDRVAEVYERAGDAVVDQAVRTRDFAVQQFVRARDGSRELIRENPLAVGALAMATGIGIGLLLPSTKAEDELYGETRERLVGEARETAAGIREAAQNLGDVAKDTASAII